MSTDALKMDRSSIIKWLITIAVGVVILLIPESADYTYEVKMFLFVTIVCIMLVAFEILNLMAVSMLFPMGYIMAGIMPMDVAFSAWTMTMPTVVIGGYLIANVLDRIGLLRRIAYFTVIKVGGSYYGLLYGIFIAGTFFNVATGGNAWVIMAAFTFGMCKAFDLGRSIDSAIIMFVGALSAASSCHFFYTPYFMTLLFAPMKTIDPNFQVSWMGYAFQMLPYTLFILAFIFIIPKIIKPTKQLPGKAYFQEEYEKLGKMSTDEKKALAITVFLILFMFTGPLHGLMLDWAFMLIPWFFYFPFINVGREEDIVKINWSMVFFCVACLSIGVASSYIGIGALVAAKLVPMLQGMSASWVALAVFFVSIILNFVLTPLAILAGFSEPITQIALGLNMNPQGLLYALYIGADQILFPYEYLSYLIFYAFGLIRMGDFMKLAGLKMVLTTILMVAVLIPWWRLLGIL